ncbi:uncharacterized protein VTP21DRAFT_2624 [Calcarisporiella thermophila]|uniref:uncharacterized protein n=1 Tax=Calcarisporiella thermophila TaxID=911321 RepID=UPI00374241DD
MAEQKYISTEEVSKYNTRKELWVLLHNKVYNITKFMDEHPGGEEVLLDVAGQDCTEAFEDVGHSQEARDMLSEYYVGDLDPSEVTTSATKSNGSAAPISSSTDGKAPEGNAFRILVPIVLFAGWLTYRYLA